MSRRSEAITACARSMACAPLNHFIHTITDDAHERGRQDLAAMRCLYHSEAVERAVIEHATRTYDWPRPLATALAVVFEYLRWELLGVRQFPGLAVNIADYWRQYLLGSTADPVFSLMLSLRTQCAGLQVLEVGACVVPGSLFPLMKEVVADQFSFAAAVMVYVHRYGLVDGMTVAAQSGEVVLLPPEPLLPLRVEEPAEEDVSLTDSDAVGEIALPLFDDPCGDDYCVYDARFDSLVIDPTRFGTDDTLQQHQVVARQRRVVRRLARELTRQLLARSQPAWRENLDEGRLYPARLSRVVSSPAQPPIRLYEQRVERRDSVICLLLDCSGSMRGLPIRLGLECCALLAEALDVCAVKTEILGFTTDGPEDNRPLRQWRAAGSPPNAGRLNSLRHIVFKSADQHWRKARRRFPLALDPAVMQENIDGEALLWARQRLLSRTEARKILFVIGDGKPCDPATREANGNSFLDYHLRQVIEQIENDRAIELYAIGTSPAVTRYYSRAVILGQLENFGCVLLNQIKRILLQ